MDLPTYTNIWRIEKRLYKLYDFRLPMPLPINWIAVFAGITVPYIVLLVAVGLPFNHTLVWLYVLPPGLLTWLTTRPVIENKRLPELVESQVRYLAEPRVWCRLAPLNEKDQVTVTARVWHSRRAPRRKAAMGEAATGSVALRHRGTLARRGRGVAVPVIGDPAEGNAPLAAASALAATSATVPARSRARSRARGTGGPGHPVPAGRRRPAAGKTPAPEGDWAAQQREAAQQAQPQQAQPRQDSRPGQRARTTGQRSAGRQGGSAGQHDQTSKHGRFRLAALRSRPAGPAPALPPGVALRPPADPARSRPAGLAQPGQSGSLPPWREGPSRPGQARPEPGIWGSRSAPPLSSVMAPVSSDRPAHATPEVYPAIDARAPSDMPPAALMPPDLPAHVTPDVRPATEEPASPEVHPRTQARSSSDVEMPSSALTPPAAPPGAPRVEIAHDGPARRPVPPAPVRPVNPVPAAESAESAQAVEAEEAFEAQAIQDADETEVAEAAEEAEEGHAAAADHASGVAPAEVPPPPAEPLPVAEPSAPPEPLPPVEALPPVEPVPPAEVLPQAEVPQAEVMPPLSAPVVTAVTDAEHVAVPSIERALSGPAKHRDLSWHGPVKIVAGETQGPGKRDQEALDRARARLPLKTPKRVVVLGCTSGGGQTMTALMTGHILASLRDEPVAAVDLHDGALARTSAPAAWLEDVLNGMSPQSASKARPDGLHPTAKAEPARLDVIASRDPLRDVDELKLAVQLARHYSLAMFDPGATGLTRLLKTSDQLVIVVPASVDGAGALADTRDWLETHGFGELAGHSVTVINGVSRRSLPDVEQAESVARGRCRAIVRVPWDDMLPAEVAGPSALRPQTRVAYTALAGVLVAGLAAAPIGTGR